MTVNAVDTIDIGHSHQRQPLEWLTVAGFKSIGPVQRLEMRKVSIVIGANGSGKSNLVEVFAFLEALREGRLQEYVARAGGADRILHFGAKTTDKLTIEASFRNDANQYEIALVPDDADRLTPVSKIWNRAYLDRTRACFGRRQLYHVHNTKIRSIRRTCALHDNAFLRADGSNLAAILYLLRKKHEGVYDLIRRSVRLVAPFFDDFVLMPTPFNENMIRLEWSHVGSDAHFDATSLSDGTLRFIVLTTLLLQPKRLVPSIVVLDQPELGLHPYAITMLCSLVKSAASGTQIVIATQSPLMLDHFEPEDLLVAERRKGASTFTRLDSRNLDPWLEDYSLGQLWEKNELGGRPQHRERSDLTT